MLVVLFVLLATFLLSSDTYAAETSVVLNEIYAPTSSEDWVELYNAGGSEIDLSGWELRDAATTPMKTIPDNTRIPPSGLLVFEVSNRLNNSGDTVRLVDKNGMEVDRFEYSSSTAGRSFARLTDGKDWQVDQNPTKGSTNGTKPPGDTILPPSTGQVFLTEFMPNPNGGNEWAEVYNPQDFEINIGGWKIDDIEGASSPYSIPEGTKIDGKSYAVFSFSAKLNNSGDTIRLLNPSGEVVESRSFGETTKGISFAKDSQGNWQITATPTPGATNKITPVDGSTKSSTAKTTGKSKTSVTQTSPTLPTITNQELGNPSFEPSSGASGKVAGATSQSTNSKNLSTLLIAAGFSFLVTAIAWPILEKNLWKK